MSNGMRIDDGFEGKFSMVDTLTLSPRTHAYPVRAHRYCRVPEHRTQRVDSGSNVRKTTMKPPRNKLQKATCGYDHRPCVAAARWPDIP